MSAGEIYEVLQKQSRTKLPSGQIPHFGRFLKKVNMITFNSNRGKLYLVVGK